MCGQCYGHSGCTCGHSPGNPPPCEIEAGSNYCGRCGHSAGPDAHDEHETEELPPKTACGDEVDRCCIQT